MDNGLPPADQRPSARPATGHGAVAKGGGADPRKEAPSAPGAAKRKNPAPRNGGNGAGSRSHSNGATKPVAKAAPRIARSSDTTAPKGLVTPKVEHTSPIIVAEPESSSSDAPDTGSPFPLLLPKIVEAEPAAAKAPAPAAPSAKAPAADTPMAKSPVATPSVGEPSVVEPSTKALAPSPSAPKPSPALPALPTLAPSAPATVAVPLPVGAPVEFTDTDCTDGLPSLRRPKRPPRALRAPVVRPKRAPRVRRVTRVVRHVDSWSVFKVALVFNLFLYAVLLTAGVLLWQVAQNTGTVDNIERFFESFGWERFELKGGEIYHNAWVAGLFVVVGLTGLAVLMATLFNLITDLVGGIRVSVLEEEVIAREDRGLGWRRGSRPTVATPAGNPGQEPSGDDSQPG